MDFLIGSVALAVTTTLGKEALNVLKEKRKHSRIPAKKRALYELEQQELARRQEAFFRNKEDFELDLSN